MNKQENKISFNEYVKANTDQDQFKIIDDEKNTPTLKEAQDFVGGYVECITYPNRDLLIVNEENKLVGTLTDGDIRRILIKSKMLEKSVLQYLNKSPVL